jgi:ABC-type xylose transport system permease subunit
MEWAALISWIVTAGGGFVLFSLWLRHGGMRQREPGRHIRPPLILSHFALAATGLVLWIIYVITDSDALAWISLAILVLVAILGFAMFAVWWQRRQEGVSSSPGATLGDPAEQRFPAPIVALHGLLAVTTLVLVLLAAVGV